MSGRHTGAFSWCATLTIQPAMIMSGVYFRRALAKEPPMSPVTENDDG